MIKNNILHIKAANDNQLHSVATTAYGFYFDACGNFQLAKLEIHGNQIKLFNPLTREFSVPALRSQFVQIIPEREVLKFISEYKS